MGLVIVFFGGVGRGGFGTLEFEGRLVDIGKRFGGEAAILIVVYAGVEIFMAAMQMGHHPRETE